MLVISVSCNNKFNNYRSSNCSISSNCITCQEELKSFQLARIKFNNKLDSGMIMPYDYSILDNVRCIQNKNSTKKRRTINLFGKNNDYHWEYWNFDYSFMENDSLKNLTEKEKLQIIKNSSSASQSKRYLEINPFKFEPTNWYVISSINYSEYDNDDGSYFIYVNEDGTLKIHFFSGGP